MDRAVRWSPEAIEDVAAIAEYIARDSVQYARAVVAELLATARAIGRFPLLGRKVPETDDDQLRERFVYSYRLVYRVEPEQILIVAVIHGKRLLDGIADRLNDAKTR